MACGSRSRNSRRTLHARQRDVRCRKWFGQMKKARRRKSSRAFRSRLRWLCGAAARPSSRWKSPRDSCSVSQRRGGRQWTCGRWWQKVRHVPAGGVAADAVTRRANRRAHRSCLHDSKYASACALRSLAVKPWLPQRPSVACLVQPGPVEVVADLGRRYQIGYYRQAGPLEG
jgi:hypothetical protein